MAVFDLGNPDDWPSRFRAAVTELAEGASSHPEFDPSGHSSDLASHENTLTRGADERIVEALGDDMFVAHHASRLMPHEIDGILADGMQPANWELVDAKLAAVPRGVVEVGL